jgi:hypothetical protein
MSNLGDQPPMTESTLDDPTGDREPNSRLRIALVVLVVVIAAAVAILALNTDDDDVKPQGATTTTESNSQTTATTAADPDLAGHFSGTGDDTSESFEVTDNWEIRWQAADSPFEVELFTEDGSSRGTIVTSSGDVEGSTFVVEAGRFYLMVRTTGDWSVDIVDPG